MISKLRKLRYQMEVLNNMSKYNVHGGHNKIVPGASGYLDEVTEDRKVKNAVIKYLKAEGHTVYDCTDDVGTSQSKNLANIVAKCNAHSGITLDISIHLNSATSSTATGVECLYYTNAGKAYATKISAKVASALELRDRGPKYRDNLAVLKRTKAVAVLVECCFVTCKADKNAWDVDKCAKAIVEAVLDKSITSSTSSSSGKTNVSSGSNITSTSNSSDDLKVDGYWGTSTTKKLQKIFKTTVDGKVSNQYVDYKSQNPGLDSGWEWEKSPSGYSPLIKAIQKRVNKDIKAGLTEDGHIGPKTIKGIQKWLNCSVVDGVFSRKSPAIKKLQQWANAQ